MVNDERTDEGRRAGHGGRPRASRQPRCQQKRSRDEQADNEDRRAALGTRLLVETSNECGIVVSKAEFDVANGVVERFSLDVGMSVGMD